MTSHMIDRVEPHARPIRVGVFPTIRQAELAVEKLLASGFSRDEVSVFSPEDEAKPQVATPEPPETGLPVDNLLGGSLLGGILGGLTAVAGLATVAGIPVLVAGGMAGALSGGIAGGLVGVMVHRGVEKEPANYFDQAVAQGSYLVAVEMHDDKDQNRLADAARVLFAAGAKPLPLREG